MKTWKKYLITLLAGFVMGPVGGGLASGIGAALYDLLNPAYVTSAPFTSTVTVLSAAKAQTEKASVITRAAPNTAAVFSQFRI